MAAWRQPAVRCADAAASLASSDAAQWRLGARGAACRGRSPCMSSDGHRLGTRARASHTRRARSASMVHGNVTIGRLSGNLLTGMTVHDFSITDSQRRAVRRGRVVHGEVLDRFTAAKAHLDRDAVIVRPLIVLDRPPNGKWNWQRIFPRDTMPKSPTQQPGWGDWIRFTNAKVVNGQLIVRTPWKPSSGLSGAARDSVIREALAGKSRLIIEQVSWRISEDGAARFGERHVPAAAPLRTRHEDSACSRSRHDDDRVSIPAARRHRARSQGCVRVQQRLGVVEGRVRRDARSRRRAATAAMRSPAGTHAVRAQRSREFRRHAVGVSAAAGGRTRQAGPRARSGAARCRTIWCGTPTSRSAGAHGRAQSVSRWPTR